MNTVYSNALPMRYVGTMPSMQLMRMHATGFLIGFACGTLGIFALALLRLSFPAIEFVTIPFFWPGRFFAMLLGGGPSSTQMIVLLYLITGMFYGVCGSVIQECKRRVRFARVQGMQ